MIRSSTIRAPLAALATAAGLALAAAPPSPAATPTVFAPGEISAGVNVDAATFAPQGDLVYFDENAFDGSTIMVSRQVAGHWQAPEVAPFSGVWRDLDPAMSPDGRFLVFCSNRPAAPGGAALDSVGWNGKLNAGKGAHLWRVDRAGAGWGEPMALPATVNDGTRLYSPSVAADGSVYFQRPDAASHTFHLARSQWRDGRYDPPTRVAIGPDGADERDPAVAPDESFIVFSANYGAKDAPHRLHIAFREGDRWGAPIDLGDAANIEGAEGPHLGPDGRTLYFDSPATASFTWPRTREQTAADLRRARLWDNGNSHLWQLSLAPWLAAHAAGPAQAS